MVHRMHPTYVFLGIAIWAFIWAVNNDQFDDMDSAASSILFDDDPPTIDAAKTEDIKKSKDCATAIKNNQDSTGDRWLCGSMNNDSKTYPLGKLVGQERSHYEFCIHVAMEHFGIEADVL